MSAAPSLSAEWERLGLLATCVSRARGGGEISPEHRARLQALQERVGAARAAPAWRELSTRCGLDTMDQDILACTLAPEVEPRLGWLFQELQPGIGSVYPTAALIRELLFLGDDETPSFQARLAARAPLRRHGLVEAAPREHFQPLRPTPRARRELLRWDEGFERTIPGAIELPAHGRWDDLVLPAGCTQALREYLLWVTHREQVAGQWGARLAGGPVALFAGPSGTGKTFAAEVVSNALGWRLYVVDLGHLVSKYVGETEKNLSALFEAAAGEPVVLLFDEADSLFGRRGEIKDARDRYANMEVSHLLSRIERHPGPCILTTNLRQSLDPAFVRRFHVVVEFPRPDAAARAELWRRHLPPRAPLAADVTLADLAAVALSGGQIRNAALHAAFLAAADGAPIGRPQLARAIWRELAKDGREFSPATLGTLAAHLPAEAA